MGVRMSGCPPAADRVVKQCGLTMSDSDSGEERQGGPTRGRGRADRELQDQPRVELGHQSEGGDFSTEAVATLREDRWSDIPIDS